MTAHLLQRKGAHRIALIPAEVLDALNAGLVPTVSLTEFLAIDTAGLAQAVALQVGLDPQAERLQDALAMLPSFAPMKRHSLVAHALYQLTEPRPDRDAIAHALATHASDVPRCWATEWIAIAPMPLADKLTSVRRFASDAHFGVREMAWMAVRNAVAADVDAAIALLQPWVHEDDANLRRFASEGTRPRGVWCAQIDALKAEPWRALPLLEPLRADPSRYVQLSVANWLNDASKTQPEWVMAVCDRWRAQSKSPATSFIVNRALRTLRKQGQA